MSRPTARLWSAISAAAALLACGGSTEQDLVTPSGEGRCALNLAVPLLPATSSSVTAQLNAARDCAWSARAEASWLQVEPTAGQGAATLTLTAAANPQGRNRPATLVINDRPFTVTQEAAACTFEVAPMSVTVGHQGGRVLLELTTLDGCVWTTQSSQSWLRVVSGSGGDASATLELAVDSNTGAERSALLAVSTLLVAVTQNAGPNDRTECRFSLSPGSRTLPAAGGTGSFTVSTAPGCAWTANGNQPWITIVSSLNMVGSGTVVYRVDPNPGSAVRSGAVSAGTRRHVVRQDGQPRQ